MWVKVEKQEPQAEGKCTGAGWRAGSPREEQQGSLQGVGLASSGIGRYTGCLMHDFTEFQQGWSLGWGLNILHFNGKLGNAMASGVMGLACQP